jgi:hypothetical protein
MSLFFFFYRPKKKNAEMFETAVAAVIWATISIHPPQIKEKVNDVLLFLVCSRCVFSPPHTGM